MILDTDALVKRLRYQGEQYSNGSASRGGSGEVHYLTQAANRITELEAQLEAAKQVANDCRIVADNAIAEAAKNQWQPIETAPKDGTEAIVYTPAINGEDERYNFEKYLEDEGGWIVHANHYEHFCMIAKGGADCHWTGPSEKPKYTHWMPLPKPPSMKHKEQAK